MSIKLLMNDGREQGTIVRVDRHGLAMVKTARGNATYPFTFDKIRHYRGQTASEIGLKQGATVSFRSYRGKVSDVEISDKAMSSFR